MNRLRKNLIFVVLLAICLYCQPAFSLMLKIEFPELVKDAEVILIGRVDDMDSELEDNRGSIFTYVTIIPEEIIKGALTSPEVIVKIPGGEVGEIGLKVSDVPEFELEERVLLFLKSDTKTANLFKIPGLFQGKFTILSDNTLKENTEPLEGFKGKIRQILEK